MSKSSRIEIVAVIVTTGLLLTLIVILANLLMQRPTAQLATSTPTGGAAAIAPLRPTAAARKPTATPNLPTATQPATATPQATPMPQPTATLQATLAPAPDLATLVPTVPPEQQEPLPIAFVSGRDRNSEIYLMDAEGQEQHRLTNHPAVDLDPDWSPDGQRIAFTSLRDGNPDIYLMNPDGSNLARLTTDPAEDYQPAWAPNGSQIAFISKRGEYGPTIHLMNADGSQVIDTGVAVSGPFDWSPDGRQIAFSNYNGGNLDIFIMNSDGSNIRLLISTPTNDSEPVWSPDGHRIAFVSGEISGVNDGTLDIYIAHADGSGLVNLTNTPANDQGPEWSPDGTQIMFVSMSSPRGPAESNYLELHMVRVDGGGAARLTDTLWNDYEPTWRR